MPPSTAPSHHDRSWAPSGRQAGWSAALLLGTCTVFNACSARPTQNDTQGTSQLEMSRTALAEQLANEQFGLDRVERPKMVEALHAKYGGMLHNFATTSAVMTEWNPIGFSADDVRHILGPPTDESAQIMTYEFGDGRGVGMWSFGLHRGVVYSVECVLAE